MPDSVTHFIGLKTIEAKQQSLLPLWFPHPPTQSLFFHLRTIRAPDMMMESRAKGKRSDNKNTTIIFIQTPLLWDNEHPLRDMDDCWVLFIIDGYPPSALHQCQMCFPSHSHSNKDKSHSLLFFFLGRTHMGCKCDIKTAGWVTEEPKFQWWIKLKWPTLNLIDKILLQHINGLHWLLIWSFSSEPEPSTQTTHCVNYAKTSLSNLYGADIVWQCCKFCSTQAANTEIFIKLFYSEGYSRL